MNWTPPREHRVLAVAAGLALLALPAAAAGHARTSAPTAVSDSIRVDRTVTLQPATATTTPASAGGTETAQPPATTTGARATESSQDLTAAASIVGAATTDESGSTEARTVQRSCGAPADPHYVPSDGREVGQCYDGDGVFRANRTYSATHYTNDVECGNQNELPQPLSVTDVAWYGSAGTTGGYGSVCSDGLTPIHGRATVRGDADGSAEVVVDGDQDNPEETTQGWASGTISADGPTYRCGRSYDDGGRGTADAPTSADNAEQCSP